MAEKIRGIVLNVRKYNDRNIIVTLYTREKGRISFISPTGSGKASNVRRARLQPLAVVETEVNFKAGVELQRLGSLYTPEVWNDIYFHPVKRAISIFISEFLYRLLNASMPDPVMYEFLEGSIRLLNKTEVGIEDFHLVFLVLMLTYSGIQPNVTTKRNEYVFEFASGSFVPKFEANGPFIEGIEADAVTFISRLNFRNIKCLRLNSSNRRQILYALLNYYSYHFPGLSTLKTPEILREIFE